MYFILYISTIIKTNYTMTTSQLKLDIVKVINNLTDQIINLNEYNSMGLLMPEEYNINIKRLLKLRAASRNNLMMLSF